MLQQHSGVGQKPLLENFEEYFYDMFIHLCETKRFDEFDLRKACLAIVHLQPNYYRTSNYSEIVNAFS